MKKSLCSKLVLNFCNLFSCNAALLPPSCLTSWVLPLNCPSHTAYTVSFWQAHWATFDTRHPSHKPLMVLQLYHSGELHYFFGSGKVEWEGSKFMLCIRKLIEHVALVTLKRHDFCMHAHTHAHIHTHSTLEVNAIWTRFYSYILVLFNV